MFLATPSVCWATVMLHVFARKKDNDKYTSGQLLQVNDWPLVPECYMPKEAWILKEMGFNSQAEKIFSLSQSIQSSCGAHPASYSWVKCFVSPTVVGTWSWSLASHLVSRFSTHKTIPLLLYVPSWCGLSVCTGRTLHLLASVWKICNEKRIK